MSIDFEHEIKKIDIELETKKTELELEKLINDNLKIKIEYEKLKNLN